MAMPEIIIAGVFTIIGAAIGVFGSYIGSRRTNRNEAANNLRSTFLPITAKINTHGFSSESEFRNTVVGSFLAHATEIERYRFFVPCKDRDAYDKAYDDYRDMVSKKPIGIGHKLPPEEFFIKTVNNILHFAKPL